MTRTVIHVDDEMFAETAEILDTTTNAAPEAAIKRRKRASFLGWLVEGGLPDLTGPVETEAA